MKDYREKDVDGIICIAKDPNGFLVPMKARVTVRMTSDKIGQSLSLAVGNIMISIPLESVRNIVRVTGKEKSE